MMWRVPEIRKKMVHSTLSDEHRKKLSESHKGKASHYGVHPSNEFKKGHTVSEDVRMKMRLAKLGKPSLKKGRKYPHGTH